MHYQLSFLQPSGDPTRSKRYISREWVCSESQNSAAFNEASDLLLLLCCFLLTTITEASLLNQLLRNWLLCNKKCMMFNANTYEEAVRKRLVWVCKCRNECHRFLSQKKGFSPTPFLSKEFSSSPLEASPCISRDSFGNYRTKKKQTEDAKNICATHRSPVLSLLLPGGDHRALLQCWKPGQGREAACLTAAEGQQRTRTEGKLCNHCSALLPATNQQLHGRVSVAQSRLPTKYFQSLF